MIHMRMGSIHVATFIKLILLVLVSNVCCVRNKTSADLHHHLFQNYVKDVRPVIDAKTTTHVTYRLLIKSLLALDTRDQSFSIGTSLKAVWSDEYLRWDPDDYDGIDTFNVPITSIWIPDITLIDNADIGFERYKPDTRAQIYSDGTIIWFVPIIFTKSCNIRVQWFPFDTQVCDMRFLSWSHDGFQINLEAEKSADASQDSYGRNGVWDLVAFRSRRIVTKYLCCPAPYPEVQYRLVFKRHAAFYIYYMVLPCLFLSILSLLVFYLPPDCGEKLTLSITNLLALVVFQQIIAENMPPSSDDSPVIGTYFICMIAMVCISVISTGFVMHVSGISQPMPRWIKRIFLEIVPRSMCLSVYSFQAHHIDAADIFENQHNNDNAVIANGKVASTKENVDSVGVEPKTFNKTVELLRYIKEDIDTKNTATLEHLQWRRVSIIIDRMLLYLFSTFTIVCTFYLAVQIVTGSMGEYDEILYELEEDWPI
ncbi:neuronal acetylcholine receptor subunit beta-3-like [Amphiura filiformis]|uniref:neuronal acetylcholine receptor subunit beta-3-like n=1 Tax=Amphiura filiformis TaxID=82378 RepID=UPI003B228BA9